MTPQEIFEYKRQWQPGVSVGFCSDLEDRAKKWVKENCERQSAAFVKYTDNYEHTFQFEKEADREAFVAYIISIDSKFVYRINGEKV